MENQILKGGIYPYNNQFVIAREAVNGKLVAEVLKWFKPDFYGPKDPEFETTENTIEIDPEELGKIAGHEVFLLDHTSAERIAKLVVNF